MANELPGSWPQFRHGFDSNGFTHISGPSGLGVERPVVQNHSLPAWQSVLSSPVLDDDDNVYVTTTGGLLVGYSPDGSSIVNTTLNETRPQGQCQLQHVPKDYAHYATPLTASPVVIGPGVIAGSVIGRFIRLEFNGGTVKRWSYSNTTGACYSAALLGRGEVVFTSQSGVRVFAMDLAKDPPVDRWTVSLPAGLSSIQAGPSVANDGTIYVSSHGGLESAVYAITAAGKLASYSWRLSAVPFTTAAIFVSKTGHHTERTVHKSCWLKVALGGLNEPLAVSSSCPQLFLWYLLPCP